MSFAPILSDDVLALQRRAHQYYPLDAEPFGYEARQAKRKLRGDDPRTYWQIKARPGDPTSPFVWGNFALMLVCGGHYSHEHTKRVQTPTKRKRITVSGYEGREALYAPDPDHSDEGSTMLLLARMIEQGFTWSEARGTLERHPLAGGAYWAWITQLPKFDETGWREGACLVRATGEVIEDHPPLDVHTLRDAWKSFISLRDNSGSISKGDKETYSLTTEDYSYDLFLHTVRAIISHVKTQTSSDPWADRSPWVNAEGERVATATTLRPMFKGKIDTPMRKGYLPFLVDAGVLIEYRGGIRKAQPGKGQPPVRGYRINPDTDLDDFYSEYFGVTRQDSDPDTSTHPVTPPDSRQITAEDLDRLRA